MALNESPKTALGSQLELGSLLDLEPDSSIDLDLSIAIACARKDRNRSQNASGIGNVSGTSNFLVSQPNSDGKELVVREDGHRRSPRHVPYGARTPTADRTGGTSIFGGSSIGDSLWTGGRGRLKKALEWEQRLQTLYELFRDLSVGNVDGAQLQKLQKAVEEGFEALTKVLASVSSTHRPTSIFTLVTVYAVNLVKLQQLCVALNVQGMDTVLCSLLHETLSFWLNARARLRDDDRQWTHTRHVLRGVLRHVNSFSTLIALKHNLTSMLAELLTFLAKEDDQRYAVYACEVLEGLSCILTQQMIASEKDKLF